MAPKVIDYRPAQDRAASSPPVEVERSVGGSVTVRVSCPAVDFRQTMIGMIVACCIVTAFPIPFIWFTGWSIPGLNWLAVSAWMFFVALATSPLVLRVWRLAQSYTLEADLDGITIHRYRGRREWTERLPRERITDVRIGFGSVGKSRRSTAWLVIAVNPWYRPNRGLLHDLGGNHLAVVADAIREGLGLVAVDWPSGRPRKRAPEQPRPSKPAEPTASERLRACAPRHDIA